MKVINAIRQLYTPIQPTVKKSADGITYAEFLPDARLQNFIYCYWQLKTTQPLSEPYDYRVVADGCMDIFFEVNNPQESFVMGFSEKYTAFPLEHTFNYIGIRFLPTIFPQIFKIDASELSNHTELLSHVIPFTSQFIQRNFNPLLAEKEMIAMFDAYFLDLISKISFDFDSRVYGAIHIILKNSGGINIETDLNTGISPRQLRRLFDFYIGDTAKTFSKIVRFQNILKAKPSTQSLRKSKMFFDAGYYDQAHFIKEFRTLYGATPAKALLD